MDKYDDIINLERFEPLNHDRMPIEKRASIFSPFAALSGFSDKINEVERYKDERILLSEDDKNNLDLKISDIKNNLNLKKNITVIYYNHDKYIEITGSINKIDEIKKFIILNNTKILFDDIIDIRI